MGICVGRMGLARGSALIGTTLVLGWLLLGNAGCSQTAVNTIIIGGDAPPFAEASQLSAGEFSNVNAYVNNGDCVALVRGNTNRVLTAQLAAIQFCNSEIKAGQQESTGKQKGGAEKNKGGGEKNNRKEQDRNTPGKGKHPTLVLAQQVTTSHGVFNTDIGVRTRIRLEKGVDDPACKARVYIRNLGEKAFEGSVLIAMRLPQRVQFGGITKAGPASLNGSALAVALIPIGGIMAVAMEAYSIDAQPADFYTLSTQDNLVRIEFRDVKIKSNGMLGIEYNLKFDPILFDIPLRPAKS